eukprot:TRINITY_DN6244_c0_g1_i1.p1 TRINITY_DN6244_c0_g1~~TRINITY_DN6244_c0_g1_i1.p1  ORF type:complete len:225 (-),score=9.96 TRINITY_DN6244_c0_g1_i1:21-695(-)
MASLLKSLFQDEKQTVVILNAAVLVGSIGWLVLGNSVAYRMALAAVILSCGLTFFKRHGFRFERSFLQTLLVSNDIHYLIISLGFWFDPYTYWLIPVCIRSLFLVTKNATFPAQYAAYAAAINAKYDTGMEYKAWTEIYMCFMLVLELFFGHARLIPLLITYNITRTRYYTSPYSRRCWTVVGRYVESAISSAYCPSTIAWAVRKIKQFLTYVPQPQAQAAPAQ